MPLKIFRKRGATRVGDFVEVVEQNAECLGEGVHVFVAEFFHPLVYVETRCACRERLAGALVTAETLFVPPFVGGKTECGNRVSEVLEF